MKPIQKQTIYDVAQKTGKSASTVSAALNGTWKARRIRPETADEIMRAARSLGYSVNLQARGLRTAQSGLTGLLLPEHNNRFFSDLSQSFMLEARRRGKCPITIATQRDPAEEERTVQDLMAYSVDALFIAGAADPLRIRDLCHQAQLPHVFIDQPCPGSPSVITDNEQGARWLTQAIIDTMRPCGTGARDRIYLIGGDARLHATSRRIAGFRAVVKERFGTCAPDQVMACGYDPQAALARLIALHDRLGGLPAAIFANSINAFDGIMRYLLRFADKELQGISVGCFDYEPYGELLRLPVHMIRQRHRQLVFRAYELLEQGAQGPALVTVTPELYRAGTARAAQAPK
ncbi:MAG: LacI family DNA-binding transcriptional regulator [Paracoccus sp. (in: a-proteobacteria)]|uniref:LacI family DNA-binding transcriptional regulator n=1 Tax=Paracoccus sp. TaxID=267 RepID=UPI0039E282DE